MIRFNVKMRLKFSNYVTDILMPRYQSFSSTGSVSFVLIKTNFLFVSEAGKVSMIFWMYTGQIYSELNGSYKNEFRLGRLHLNAGGLCPIRTRASIEYWQIDELLLGRNILERINLCQMYFYF